jgi:hypothetical protein
MVVSGVYAFDFNIRPRGFVFIPLGDGNIARDGNERYSTGGGGDIGFEIDLAGIWPNALGLGYTAGLEGGLSVTPAFTLVSGVSVFVSAERRWNDYDTEQ